MDNFTPDNIPETEEYTIRGNELTTLIVQPGFVESIIPEAQQFDEVEQAFRFIFRNNREYGIVLWNGIPIRFSYIDDLPEMVEPLVSLLQFVNTGMLGEHKVRFQTKNLDLEWNVSLREKELILSQHCHRISGNYAEILNRLGMISLSCNAFLKEWKLPVAQLVEAFHRSDITITSDSGEKVIGQLKLLDETIQERGVLYQY